MDTETLPTTKLELLKQANGNLPRTKEEKEAMIKEATIHYGNFLTALGFDYKADENSRDTPRRVAKAWIEHIIKGCVNEEPRITSFPNTDGYEGIVVQTKIPVKSLCSHHNLPIIGVAHVAYVPSRDGKVIGLSKLNRIVSFISHRPQLQEALTKNIVKMIDEKCEGNLGVVCMIQAEHLCTCHRGVYHDSIMSTMVVTGLFNENVTGIKDEFLKHVEFATRK